MSAADLIHSIDAAASSAAELKEEERLNLLAACEKLKSKLESPLEATFRFLFSPLQAVALRLAVDMKLFDAAAALSANGGQIKIGELASQVDADHLLVVRIMRFLVGMEIFQEVAQGTFISTKLSGTYVSASPLAQGIIHITSQNENISALPSYFQERGYVNPGDGYNGPFQYARHTKLHCFDWLATQPRLQHAFNVVMSFPRSAHGQRWFEYFPVTSELQVNSPSDVLLVDIGGGVGHDLIAFKQHHPSLPGTLILQEISVVIESITPPLPSGIHAMTHDFFTSQPVKGAKAYYLANVLHDWPDKQALQILGHVKAAMSAESMLLINEDVLPEANVSLRSASADLVMMANFASLERTEGQWRILFEEAGLEVNGIWKPEGAGEGEGRRLMKVVPKGL